MEIKEKRKKLAFRSNYPPLILHLQVRSGTGDDVDPLTAYFHDTDTSVSCALYNFSPARIFKSESPSNCSTSYELSRLREWKKKKKKKPKNKKKKKRSRKGRVGIILHVDFHESYISTGAPHPLEQKAFPGHRRRFSMIAKSNEAEV